MHGSLWHLIEQSSSVTLLKVFHSYITIQKLAHWDFYVINSPEPNPENLSILDNSLDSINLSESDMLNALINLNPHKETGIDFISPSILKHCTTSLTAPLLHLFTSSLKTSIIPTEWKMHKIIQIYKSSDKTSVNNYRPISLLCNVSKVLEDLIYAKMIGSLSKCITPCQLGFQKNSSINPTTTALILSPTDNLQGWSGHCPHIFLKDVWQCAT